LSYYGRLSNKLSGAKLKEQIDIVLKKVHLFEDKDKLIKSYSKGMVQRIGIDVTSSLRSLNKRLMTERPYFLVAIY